MKQIKYDSEREFADNFFTHDQWEYEPKRFQLDGFTYTPDFYDMKRDVYIEVVGSPSSFYAGRRRYVSFRKLYPELKLEIRWRDGSLIDEINPNWKNQEYNKRRMNITITEADHERIRTMAYELNIKMAEIIRRALALLFDEDIAGSGARSPASRSSK